jgi:DNA-binding MarR family transcriptional regulator
VRGQRGKAAAGKRPARRNASPAVDYGTLAEFRYQLRKFLAFSEAAAHKAGLTPQQHQALLATKGFSDPEPTSVGDLARILLIRHHTAVELMDRMTKLGLLSRTVDDNDGRRVLVKLTAKAERKLRTLSQIHFEELRAASPGLTRILKSFQRARSREKQRRQGAPA